MSPLQKVALLGRGKLGTVLLTELLNANYPVTVLSRTTTPATSLPPGATLHQVDYTSFEDLKTALTGHDTIISTLAYSAMPLQKPIIDAAIAVGAKRFIPAEYGAMEIDPRITYYKEPLEIRAYLAEKAERNEIEYAIFHAGVWMEVIFSTPLIVDFEHRGVRVFDGGVHGFSVSRVRTLARAIVASLEKREETRNRVVRVHDAVLTQRGVLEMAKKCTPGEEWVEISVDARKEVEELIEKTGERVDDLLWPGLFAAVLMSGGFGAQYRDVDNELLGIEMMSEEEIEEFSSGWKS
ncbi:uncharacterized protein DSM5745_09860 [Aspergillus mulundensis]|uniref:NAD(P)-binding domain-containing protein n=1 Tax=Aspergillus mulundensis TaxID=1810919 RepID=A0A3D8QRL3_9EURO|nr:Uncharacterized protein DSM5745_09860 [Aspergillus mulundensis]RDW64449.1 Uncharacterized protein DSM5745_09860 [Aspergillus mulundensis]